MGCRFAFLCRQRKPEKENAMAMVYDITDKLRFNEDPTIRIRDVEITVSEPVNNGVIVESRSCSMLKVCLCSAP